MGWSIARLSKREKKKELRDEMREIEWEDGGKGRVKIYNKGCWRDNKINGKQEEGKRMRARVRERERRGKIENL